MKKSCSGCRALERTPGLGYRCGLGFKIKIKVAMFGAVISMMPLEQCLKPRTYWELSHFGTGNCSLVSTLVHKIEKKIKI